MLDEKIMNEIHEAAAQGKDTLSTSKVDLKEAVYLIKHFYEDCVDKDCSDNELKELVKKYPNGAEALSLRTRLFLRKMGEPV